MVETPPSPEVQSFIENLTRLTSSEEVADFVAEANLSFEEQTLVVTQHRILRDMEQAPASPRMRVSVGGRTIACGGFLMVMAIVGALLFRGGHEGDTFAKESTLPPQPGPRGKTEPSSLASESDPSASKRADENLQPSWDWTSRDPEHLAMLARSGAIADFRKMIVFYENCREFRVEAAIPFAIVRATQGEIPPEEDLSRLVTEQAISFLTAFTPEEQYLAVVRLDAEGQGFDLERVRRGLEELYGPLEKISKHPIEDPQLSWDWTSRDPKHLAMLARSGASANFRLMMVFYQNCREFRVEEAIPFAICRATQGEIPPDQEFRRLVAERAVYFLTAFTPEEQHAAVLRLHAEGQRYDLKRVLRGLDELYGSPKSKEN